MVFYPALIRRTHCRILMKPRYCKICRKKVNKKNGAKCQGDCKKWVHYSCINVPFDIMENARNEGIEEADDAMSKSKDGDQVQGDVETLPACAVSYVESSPDFHSMTALEQSDPATDTSQSKTCMCYMTSSASSLPSQTNESTYRMVPTKCDINEVCYTAQAISKEMKNLMRSFQLVLRQHEEKFASKRRCSKCNKERTTSEDNSEEN